MTTLDATPTQQRRSVNATRELAAFVVRARLEDLPSDLLHQARRCTTDCLGVAIGAAEESAVDMLLGVVDTLGGSPQCTVWATDRRASLAHAPLVNGYLAHVLDFDDSYMPQVTILHGNAPVVPAAMAVGEWLGASGADYLLAFILGFEVAARAALSAGRAHYDQSWHVTSTVGGFGAAAAAGKLLGLDELQMTYALGIAGAQAGGIGNAAGSMTKAFHAGRAAMSGVTAALLAQRGFTSGDDFLTGRRGFHQVFHSDGNIEALVGELGARWELRQAAFKPYACGVVVHPILDAIIGLRDEHGLSASNVVGIEARANPVVLVPTGLKEPRTGLEGKFSVYHSAAVALIDGAAGPRQYTDSRVLAAQVIALRERVRVATDSALQKGEAHVSIQLADGRVVRRHVPCASGTADNPMSDEQLDRKFQVLVEPRFGPERTGELLATIGRLESLPKISELARLLALPTASAS
jgi:2-methylcitrate dehydratase PrpD